MQPGEVQLAPPLFGNYSMASPSTGRSTAGQEDTVRDGSPEVEFGAFLRNNHPHPPRPSSTHASASTSTFAPPEPRQVTKNGRPAQSVGKMRQGAPRLGGLGLGGIVAPTLPKPSPPIPTAFPTITPPGSPSKGSRKTTTRKRSRSPPLIGTATKTLQPPAVERPFLSPEMAKPTVREGAFALDRPVPECGLPPPTTEASPEDAFSPSPTFSPHFDSSPEATQRAWRQDSTTSLQELISIRAFASEDANFEAVAEGMGMGSHGDEEEEAGDEGAESIFATPESEKDDPFNEPEVFNTNSTSRTLSEPEHHTFPTNSASPVDETPLDAPPLETSRHRYSSGTTDSSTGPRTPVIASQVKFDEVFLDDHATLYTTQPLRLKSNGLSIPAQLTPPLEREGSVASSHRSAQSSGRGSSSSRSRGVPPPRPERRRGSPSDGERSPEVAAVGTPPFLAATPTAARQESFESELSSDYSDRSHVSESFFFRRPPPRNVSNPQHELPSEAESEAPSEVEVDVVRKSPPSSPRDRPASWYGLGLRMPSSLKPSALATNPENEEEPRPPVSATVPSKEQPSSIPILPSPVEVRIKNRKTPISIAPSIKPTVAETGVKHVDSAPPENIPPPVTSLPTPSPSPPMTEGRLPEVPANTSVITSSPSDVSQLSTAVAASVDVSAPKAVEEVPTSPNPGQKDVLEQMEAGDSVGLAVAGAVISGTFAVGYGAWRGLSAVASAGWGWGKSASPIEDTGALEERPSPNLPLPGSFEGRHDDLDEAGNVDEEAAVVEAEDEPAESSVMSTEWGDVAFPAPAGFVEAFKQAMAELGPEDIASNDLMEQEAQDAAYKAASRQHEEAFSPDTSFQDLPPTFSDQLKPHAIEQWRVSNSEYARSLDGSEYSEFSDHVAPMLSDRQSPIMRSRFIAPPGLQGPPPPAYNRQVSTSPSITSTAGSEKSSRSIFGFKRTNSKGKKSAPSPTSSPPPPVPSLPGRTPSVFSNDSAQSHSTSKTLKRKSLPFGGMTKSPSFEQEVQDVNYVSYSSGRTARRRDSTASSASSDTGVSPIPTSRLLPGTQRSSLRAESRYSGSRSKRASLKLEPKKMYSVRFANATHGLGLRSVAEDEAERAGGESHAMKWIGVGRGRYGNLMLETDESSDVLYAEQAALIKKKWRGFGAHQRDWANVKID